MQNGVKYRYRSFKFSYKFIVFKNLIVKKLKLYS